MTHGIETIALLFCSNIMMTFAWYGHLKLNDYTWFAKLPLIGVIAFCWGIAFFEYCLQVPANRLGYVGTGGPFNLFQLKVLQEVITLTVFVLFSIIVFHLHVHWNHLVAAVLLILAVYFVFRF